MLINLQKKNENTFVNNGYLILGIFLGKMRTTLAKITANAKIQFVFSYLYYFCKILPIALFNTSKGK